LLPLLGQTDFREFLTGQSAAHTGERWSIKLGPQEVAVFKLGQPQ